MNRTKNYTKKIGLFLIVISGIIQFNCKKEVPKTNDPGLALIEAPVGFAVTSNFSYNYTPASTTGPSFSNPNTVFYFQAGFNAEVTWTITINDFTSGAVKTLTGTSNTINESNGRWDGSHDGLYYFNSGDVITATLTFVGSSIKLSSGTFTVTSINAFNGYTGFIMGEKGYINAETYGTFNFGPEPNYLFTSSSVYLQSWPWYVTGPGSAQGGKQGAYGDTPADPFYGGVAVTNQIGKNSNPSVPANVYTLPLGFAPIEGNGAYMLYGTDYNFDYFIAGIKAQTTWVYQGTSPVFSSPSQGGIPYTAFPSNAHPDSLWFNIYIYGTGDVISQFHWNIEEDDNGDHVHYDTSEDVYYYEITTSHTGWKLISVPYSDMLTSPSPKNGGKGNHIQEPRRITAIGLQVLSSPPGQTAKVIFDYPTITLGKPYNPNL